MIKKISAFASKISALRLKVSKPPQLYTSCSELPMVRFIACVSGEDFKPLHKPGSPPATPEQLAKAWDLIFYEYVDLVKDPDQLYALGLMRDIAVLESDLRLTAAMITFLSMRFSEEVQASLRKMGYRCSLKEGDHGHNTNELERLIKQRKARILTLSQRKNQLETHQSKQKKQGKSEPADYDKILTELSAFQGYRLDPAYITVSEYVAISNRYKKHVEASKKKNNQWKK